MIDGVADIRTEHMDRFHTNDPTVEFLEVTEKEVVLDLPADIRDCERVIPRDAVTFGDESNSWFLWDMEEKVPRSPHRKDGYAGRVRWGRDNVSENDRAGSTFMDTLTAINTSVRSGSFDESWRWHDDDEGARPLFPLMIMPHADFSPEPGLIFFDFDDVIRKHDDGTGSLSREAWDIIQKFGGYAEVSTSKTGVHMFLRGRLPDFVGQKAVIEFDGPGELELWGYPGNGRITGTTWAHIGGTEKQFPHVDEELRDFLDENIDEEEKEANRNDNNSTPSGAANPSGSASRSLYWGVSLKRVVSGTTYTRHTKYGTNGPHPKHGGTTCKDSESTNFGVDNGGWQCWKHDSTGGALQMIAILEGICSCKEADRLHEDPTKMLKTCLRMRDDWNVGITEDDNPPTMALKGVLEIMNKDYPDRGKLSKTKYRYARKMYDIIEL